MNSKTEIAGGNGDVRPTLLIADDDAVMRSVLGSQLEGSFEFVGAATNATEAIQLAEEHQPDCALIDLEMPHGGAVKAVPRIATVSPGTSMVILSGDESESVVQELLNAGAIAYVRKGVTGAEITETLMNALKANGGPRRG